MKAKVIQMMEASRAVNQVRVTQIKQKKRKATSMSIVTMRNS